MLFNQNRMRTWGPLATLLATLALAGCSDDDRKGIITPGIGSGEVFHGAEWATIKDLDPRGEQCIDCHGKSADMSPNGKLAHNIGMQKMLANRVENLSITNVEWGGWKDGTVPVDADGNYTGGSSVTVTFTAGANYARDRNIQLNLARLAPNISQTQGANNNNEVQLYDWTNYLLSQSSANAGVAPNNEPYGSSVAKGVPVLSNAISNGLMNVAPADVTSLGANTYQATFDLSTRNFGLHDFTVISRIHDDADWQWGDAGDPTDTTGKTYTYTDVLGIKVSVNDLSKHVQCVGTADEPPLNLATASSFLEKAGQTEATVTGEADPQYQLCWWPDGTRFPAGMFVTDDDEIVVQFRPELTHRVGMVVPRPAGTDASNAQGTNAWYDFIPATGKKPVHGVDATRDIVTAESCNSCHGVEGTTMGLQMHGGSRTQPQLCVTCHNPGNFDVTSVRSPDFKQMIHKIHRGSNLPSVRLGETDNAKGLVVRYRANERHNTRFPQGRIPGNSDGVTNCVKCHMGADSQKALAKFAQEQGAGNGLADLDALKLAKVTPDGDNWRISRSIEACQSCHDDVVWQTYTANTSGGASPLGGVLPIDSLYRRYMPSLQDKDEENWRRIHRSYAPPHITATGVITNTLGGNGTHGRANYSCGGCHFNNTYDDSTNWQYTGTGLINSSFNATVAADQEDNKGRGGNQAGGTDNTTRLVFNVHNKIVRNAIQADRFVFEILSAGVVKDTDDKATGLTATYQIVDRQTGALVTNGSTVNNILTRGPVPGGSNITVIADGSSTVTVAANVMFGWMEGNSPDYTHSAGNDITSSAADGGRKGGQGIPGSPTAFIPIAPPANNPDAYIAEHDGNGIYTVNYLFDQTEGQITAANLEAMLASGTRGTVALTGHITVDANNGDSSSAATAPFHEENPGRIRVKSANFDFRFDGDPLLAGEGRREVIDFDQTCKNCHMQLAMHGGDRTNNTQICVVCHNPNMTDVNNGQRRGVLGADRQYEESEDYKRLIHAVHAAGKSPGAGTGFRIDPIVHRAAKRPDFDAPRATGFPGHLSNCQTCHVQNSEGEWTFDLNQLPAGQIGSTAITGDWAAGYDVDDSSRHDLANHMKMPPIASVCSSCHDAGY